MSDVNSVPRHETEHPRRAFLTGAAAAGAATLLVGSDVPLRHPRRSPATPIPGPMAALCKPQPPVWAQGTSVLATA